MLKKLLYVSLLGAALLVSGCSGTDSKEIKIGGNLEMTGNTASYGQSMANGIKLAFKEVNAAGGVLGKQISFIVADNKSEPSESANAVTKLVTQDKVALVLGAGASSNTLAGAQIAADNKVPFITPFSTNPKVTVDNGKVNEYAFRTCFIDPFQGTVMASFAADTLKAKTAAVYIDNSSDYSKGLAQFFEESFTKKGGQIISKEAYLQKDQDFKATLTKIKAANPDVVFVPGYYEEAGKIIKQARELGITVPIIGGDGWDSTKLADIAGAEALTNTFFSNHYAADDKSPRIAKFIEAYKAEYGQIPDAPAVLGYDAAYMAVDAIKRANSADPVKIKDAIAQIKDLELVTGKITLDENHNPVKSAVVIEMKDGKQTYKTTINP
ncbi:putative secreted protein [Propionispora sp. 2/2-37]|uniref:ABC transporter substrate-binding protein n=1 Tax=Propionispora sp. 2/2-37 TaxID=1677858 RepID=UPI0006BB6CB2|nr:ABC transporter substrate-binding protein [Propionispora sp. 2/2-37]CUH96725.1 putative secreted protein [Propionispora sp. 2/2-37]